MLDEMWRIWFVSCPLGRAVTSNDQRWGATPAAPALRLGSHGAPELKAGSSENKGTLKKCLLEER
jgi:hypothetical protein